MNGFGVDLGSGAFKVKGPKGIALVYPSHISNATSALLGDLMGDGAKKPDFVKYDDDKYYTGLYAPFVGQPLKNNHGEAWLTDGESIKSIFYASMSEYMDEYGSVKTPIQIVAGVPVSMLSNGKAQKTEKAISSWMVGHHEWTFNDVKRTLDVEKIFVRSQAVGALIDYVFNEEFKPIDIIRQKEASGTVGMISIGNRTIETLVLENSRVLENMTGSEDLGVLKLLEIMNDGSTSDLGRLDVQLREGSLNGGLKKAKYDWWQLVKGHLSSTWGKKWGKFSKIILVGGGAVILKEELLTYFEGKAVIPDNPYTTIATGLQKMSTKLVNK